MRRLSALPRRFSALPGGVSVQLDTFFEVGSFHRV